MAKCNLCPRNCNIDRSLGQKGICGVNNDIYIARASLHQWEEPCISGENGSGTVFFSGCSLKCVYCQNFNVSRALVGRKVTADELSDIFLSLQCKGVHNINLVTGDHYIPQIICALGIAKTKGLNIPIVFNTSSYVNVSSLKMLSGYVDIYLADFKYHSSEISKKYSNAADYPEIAKKAIEEMHSQQSELLYSESGMLLKGVVVRNLVLPGYLSESKKILRYLYEKYKSSILISIMSQYTPFANTEKFPEINRKLTAREYGRIVDFAIELGVKNAFIQDGSSASESFIPDFNCSI